MDLKLVDAKTGEANAGEPQNWRQGKLKAAAARAQAQERLRLRQQVRVCGVVWGWRCGGVGCGVVGDEVTHSRVVRANLSRQLS